MTNRIHPWKVGAFVLLALGAMVGTAFYVGVNQLKRDSFSRVTYFDESVQGLEIGAPVKMRGVTIGQVTHISIASDQRLVRVDSDLYSQLLDEAGLVGVNDADAEGVVRVPENLRIQLASSGITGVKFLQADFFEFAPPAMELPFTPPNTYVPSIPSTLKNLEDGLYAVAQQLPRVMDRLESTMETAERKLEELDLAPLIARLDSFLVTFQGELDAGVDGELGVLGELRGSLSDLRAILAAARGTIEGLDREGGAIDRVVGSIELAGERVASLSDEASGLVTRIDGLTQQASDTLDQAGVGALAQDYRSLAQRLNAAAEEATSTMASARSLAADSQALPAEASAALRDLRRTLQSVERLAAFLERQPGALIRGKRSESSAPQDPPRNP